MTLHQSSGSTELYTPIRHQKGYAFNVDHVMQQQWLNSWNGKQSLLDIGCGFCRNSQAARDQGIPVIAADIHDETLDYLADLPENHHIDFQRLILPHAVDMDDGSVSGILCSEVFHFLAHHEVIASLWELYRLLTAGGQLFLTAGCENVRVFEPLQFAQRQEQARKRRPLFFQSVDCIMDLYEEVHRVSPQGPSFLTFIEHIKQGGIVASFGQFTLFNLSQLKNALEHVGFEVIEAGMGRADHYPLWLHGEQDQVRLIARKPV